MLNALRLLGTEPERGDLLFAVGYLMGGGIIGGLLGAFIAMLSNYGRGTSAGGERSDP
jgi:hypothetical protein